MERIDRSQMRPEASMVETEGALFPETPRFLYGRAPLTQVVAQLRFPPILRIQSGPPADFQERVRGIFPLLERGMALPVGQQIPAEILQFLAAGNADATYRFLTEDRKTTLTLSPDSISLSTTAYHRWEQFKKLFDPPFAALAEIYKPSFFSRVGLRYINAISRRSLGLENVPWSQLLRQEILGEMSLPQIEKNIDSAQRVLRMKAPGGNGGILMQHGTSKREGQLEQNYTIDLDLYADAKTEVGDAQQLLDRFHIRAFRAFKWCIADALHEALEPTELAPRTIESVRVGDRR
jgi:uncharacterized protein (TIGR04255 family)